MLILIKIVKLANNKVDSTIICALCFVYFLVKDRNLFVQNTPNAVVADVDRVLD